MADSDMELGEPYECSGSEEETDGRSISSLRKFYHAYDASARTILDIIDNNLPSEVLYRGYVPAGSFKFGFEEIELLCEVDLSNASDQIITCSVVNKDYQLSRKVIDNIRGSLRCFLELDLTQTGHALTAKKAGLVVVRLLEKATAHVCEYRQSFNKPLVDNRSISAWGVDAGVDTTAATCILGKSLDDICQDIRSDWRILHCENVMRHDLKERFLSYQQNLRRTLQKSDIEDLRKFVPFEFRRSGNGEAARQQLVDYLVQPKATLHGTKRANVPSIVQCGFVKPGDMNPLTDNAIKVVHGTTYGQGIYSTPVFEFALFYSPRGERNALSELPGIKVFICATLMGRTAILDRLPGDQRANKPVDGADSHMSRNGLEYIVFNSAQILPCYVVHLDFADKKPGDLGRLAKQAAKQISVAKNMVKSKAYVAPGDLRRQKEERIAKGMKFFAYGFGPVSGRNVVIEEVGEVDDDEEDYGDYQASRIAWEMKETLEAHFDDGTKSPMDQYWYAKKAKQVT